MLAGELPVVFPKQIHVGLLYFGSDISRRLEVQNRIAFPAKNRTLITSGKKARSPLLRSTEGKRPEVRQHNESRQIVILRAQTIRDPSTQRRLTWNDYAGVHQKDSGGVISIFC